MAVGKTLLQLTEAVRAECRRSTNASRGIDDLVYLHQVIRRNYEELYDEYDWPRKKVIRDISIQAGSYIYDFPTDLDYERIQTVRFKWGDQWLPVIYGITDDNYSVWDPENNERNDPVNNWGILDVGQGAQLEVWPLPASAGTLRLRGIKNRNELISNSDICDIDDLMVILHASAEVLGGAGQKDADLKLAKAAKRLHKMKSRASNTQYMGLGISPEPLRDREPRIRIVASSDNP